MEPIVIKENGLALIVKTDEWGNGKLVYFGREENIPAELPPADINHSIVSLQAGRNGRDEYEIWGAKQNVSNPGSSLYYVTHRDTRNDEGRKVEIDLIAPPMPVTVHWQFYNGLPIVRSWVEVRNEGTEPIGLERVSSFFTHSLGHSGKKLWQEKSLLHVCHNSWCTEVRWRSADIRDWGLDRARELTSSRIKIGNTGTWSTKDYLPLGIYENTESGEATFWQIENNGSWSWEIGDANNQLYLLAQGPNEIDNHWYHKLQPGASFTSVPAAVGIIKGGFNEAVGALTQYRREIVRPHWDHEKLPLVFNDYMNCLFADPTTEKEMPYIKTAQEMGAEIYVIDAGWYAKKGESWWTSVGLWQPSPDRFEGGLEAMLKTIRDHGMAPGLWLELEVMGVDCPLVKDWPAECFFRRHGLPIVNRGRYQLDFRHPIVIEHSDKVIDRLVNDYGVGFIKMDYNIDSGAGTEVAADSFGDGLLQHNRAYLAWLDRVFARHPKLIIENCSSGGLRTDYALLSRHTMHSITDQEDVSMNGRIAAMGPSATLPEQLGVWVYPKKDDSPEKVILNCVNGLLGRFYLSGQIAFMPTELHGLVKEAAAFHKAIRERIPKCVPFWPLGVIDRKTTVGVLGLRGENEVILAAWNFTGEAQTVTIPFPAKIPASATIASYPQKEAAWTLVDGDVSVHLPAGPSARATSITWK